MKKISLTQGKFALVDDEDFEFLNQWKWHFRPNANKSSFYAIRTDRTNGKKTTVLMHRELLSREKGVQIDHKNGDGLNNCRSNIRICSALENSRNKRPNKNSTSGFKGVSWHIRGRPEGSAQWIARIGIGYKRKILGLFRDKEEAARAYDRAAIEYFGDFAATNKSLGLL